MFYWIVYIKWLLHLESGRTIWVSFSLPKSLLLEFEQVWFMWPLDMNEASRNSQSTVRKTVSYQYSRWKTAKRIEYGSLVFIQVSIQHPPVVFAKACLSLDCCSYASMNMQKTSLSIYLSILSQRTLLFF